MNSNDSKFIREMHISLLERLLALFSVVLGIGFKWYLSGTNWVKSAKSPINNPAFFPNIIAWAFIVVGILLLLESMKTDKDKTITMNFVGLPAIALWGLYVFAMQYIGFIIASIIAIALSMLYWGAKNKKAILIASVIPPVFVYLTLGRLLGVSFPTLFI